MQHGCRAKPLIASHASHIAHCGLELYRLFLVFPIHKHSISLQLFRKETGLLKYIEEFVLIVVFVGKEDYQKVKLIGRNRFY